MKIINVNTILALLAEPCVYVADDKLGCINGSPGEVSSIALDWASRTGRRMNVRRGDGALLAVFRPDGLVEVEA